MKENLYEPTEATRYFEDMAYEYKPKEEFTERFGIGEEDFNALVEEKAKEFAAFKAEIIRVFKPQYPEAKFGDTALFEIKKAMRECAPCIDCTGFPCRKKTAHGIKQMVVYSPMYQDLSVTGKHCKYYQQYITRQRMERQFRNAKIPQRYVGKTFADYQVAAENENAVKAAHYIIDYEPLSIYFHGEVGAGKTFLTSIIAQEYLEKGRAVIYIDTPYMLRALRASFATDTLEKDKLDNKLKTLENCEVLIMDDLGAEMITEWGCETVYQIINKRYNNNRQTLITSNYSLGELMTRFAKTKSGEDPVTGKRIVSRLSEMCRQVELKGTDHRLNRKLLK